MKKILMALLVLAAPLMAKKHVPTPEPTPVATLAPTPSPLAPPWDSVRLKDSQQAEGKIRAYDAYFLSFELKSASKIQIPWGEVAELKPAEFTGDTAMMKQYLKDEPAEVQSHIQAKSPSEAVKASLYPGFFIHGYGYKKAGNQDMFLSLAGAEIFGVLVGGFGCARAADPTLSSNEVSAANTLALGGASIFALSWLIDVVGSGYSARGYNAEHHLAFGVLPRGKDSLAVASLSF